MSRIGLFVDSPSKLVIRSYKDGGMGVTANRYRVTFWNDENVAK